MKATSSLMSDLTTDLTTDLTSDSTSRLSIKEVSFEDVVRRFREEPHPSRRGYRAMYSTWYGGITRDPQLMLVPIDDHGFHRGDAVFEAIKCVDRRIYALDRHLDRLVLSANRIGLKLAHTLEEMRDIAIETTRVSGLSDALLRIYASRGPGGFTTNPYESFAPQFYLVVTAFKPAPPEKYESGVSVKVSSVAVKEGFFPNVKSCNYLPNVLMKKEAVDSGVDFTVSRDEHGYLAEGSTENFAIISKQGEFIVPGFERTLKGVTAVRMMELAQPLIAKGLITGVRNAHITLEDVEEAREAMFLGTTLDAIPVTTFEGRPINDGKVGPVVCEFLRLMLEDLRNGPLVTTID